jgi:predicted Rossmann fold flavoprotein
MAPPCRVRAELAWIGISKHTKAELGRIGSMTVSSVDAVIAGAGAAGLMCAIEAGKRGRRVVVIEHNRSVGRKILISGGGRANFTNLHTRPENFLSANPHFAKSALARYGPLDFVRLVERHGIRYHEKEAGQLFCDGAASQIAAMLEAECAAAGVQIETGCAVRTVERGGRFRVETANGVIEAHSVVIASGGLSIPRIGATAFGYETAARFGLRVVGCRPALVPLTFGGEDRARYGDLAGVSADARVDAGAAAFRGKLLFTHRGLSGPAVLQASSYWQPGEALRIDLMPGQDRVAVLRERRAAGERATARSLAARIVARRLAERWFDVGLPSKPAASLSDREVHAIAQAFQHWTVLPAGTEGYEKAEVTAGGVDTAELSSRTMESKKVPGLYFIGEVVDVTGQLGGFNFQWAWASGYSAGQAI